MQVRFAILVFVLSFAPLFGQSLLQELPRESPSLPINGLPIAVAAYDLDADGDEDLVVSETTGPVILRQQAGVFVRETFASGLTTGPAVLVAGDFDNDGNADILLGFYTGLPYYLRIYWGDGTGQFPTATFSDLPFQGLLNAAPLRIAAADLDNDGDTDFVVTAPLGYFLPGSLLIRNMTGRTFATAPTAQFPAAPAANCTPYCVDVDGDGWLDVVLVAEDNRTRLYWNNAFNFVEATAAQFPNILTSQRGLAAADFDGDGQTDLVLGGNGGPGLFLRNAAPRQLVLGSGDPTGNRTLGLHATDLDGDGDNDLLVFTRDQVEERANDGSGAFTVRARLGGCEDQRKLVEVDLDGDGDRDFLLFGLGTQVTPPYPPPTMTAVYTVTPGLFELVGASRLPASSSLTGTTTGDINGDGLADFLVTYNDASTSSTIQFVTNDGNGVFGFHWANRIGGYDNGFFVDLDGDGRDEYVFTGFGTVNGYLPNVGGTLATTMVPLPIGAIGQTTSGTGIDLDGDGDLDLVYTMAIGGDYVLRVLRNEPGGFVDDSATRVSGPFGSGSYPKLFRADFDGDGDQDVWVHSWSDDQLWLNQGGVLTFAPGAIPVNGYGGSDGAMGDFDGDGDIDLKSGTKVLRNQGGLFTLVPNALPNLSGMDSLRVAVDLDDDGDLDLLGSGVAVWNNGNGTFTNAPNVLPFVYGAGGGIQFGADIDRDGDPDAVVRIGNVAHVLVNQLRQLRLDGAADPGGQITFRYSTMSGQVALPTLTVLACSFAEVTPTEMPGLGWLRIDPTQAVLLGPYFLPATGGELVHQEPVPANPSLLGLFLCAQPLELRGSRFRLGNFVSTWIGR